MIRAFCIKIIFLFFINFSLHFIQIKCFSFQELSYVNMINCLHEEKIVNYWIMETNCTFKEMNHNTSCCFKQRQIDLRNEENSNSLKLHNFQIWMYSVGSAFFISLAGIWGYVLLPLLTGSYHDHVMNVLVGLSFGSLITSAICQLIPEAYELTSVSAKYIYIAIFSMVGLWLTALIQSLSTILGKENSKEKIQLDVFNSLGNPNHVHESSNLEGRSFHNFSSENDTENPFIHEIKKLNSENEFRNHSFCRRSSYASIKKKPKLSKLAIIILAGDCMNNFMDGISIGAGYSYQLSTGIKLSAAIAFEEYTHKLGDFAIVFQSGISMKRVLFWNYSTSCACFFGVAIGVALGNLHWSQYIFSFASGLFLYIALSNMIPEMQNMLNKSLNKSKKFALITLFEQHIGFLLSFVILIVISQKLNIIDRT